LQTREAINTEFQRRRHEIPVPTELHWDQEKPQFTISSRWLSFIVHFTPEQLVVDAEMTLAAKAFATRENRAIAVRLIDSVSDALGL
jgi:hypothetical protein